MVWARGGGGGGGGRRRGIKHERAVSVKVTAKTGIEEFLLFYSCSWFLTDSLVQYFRIFDHRTFYINERYLFHVYFITIKRICN